MKQLQSRTLIHLLFLKAPCLISKSQQSNRIVFTRTNQTAATTLFFTSKLPNVIASGHNRQVREDKKWFKIEIQNIRTGTFDYNSLGIYALQTIYRYLYKVSSEYVVLNVVMLLWWV